MTPAERSAITNGIWLCQRHAGLIDRDVGAYTARVLRDMKTAHERIVSRQLSGITQHASDTDFIAIGSDLVFTGELMSVAGFGWKLGIDHFLIGDLATLISFTERFDQIHPSDRYVLVNSLGDGRRLAAAPAWQRTDAGFVVACTVCESFPRTNVHDLPTDLVLDRAHDLTSVNGKIATVSGLAALQQTIKINLSVQRGERFRYPRFGARIKEYFDLFRDSPWLTRLIKLEVVRQACVPVEDPIPMQAYTPLRSVLRVHNVELLSPAPSGDWFPFRFALEVEGIGTWECDITVLIPRSS
jgi:phage baseplate assembly protein W